MPEDFSDLAQHGVMKGVWKEDRNCRNVFPSQKGNRTPTYCVIPAPARCPVCLLSLQCLSARKMVRTTISLLFKIPT